MSILLNQSFIPTELGAINPNTTVLDWLRGNQLVGTKEGCASGDCGACTAVVGELVTINEENLIQYKSINTCIALAYTLIGKHLITVEGLSEGDGLHPVQKAMITENGSQCGFCTPGFVMSLFALYHNEKSVDLTKINDALSGNLCRCTGYKPIISAAFICFFRITCTNNNGVIKKTFIFHCLIYCYDWFQLFHFSCYKKRGFFG